MGEKILNLFLCIMTVLSPLKMLKLSVLVYATGQGLSLKDLLQQFFDNQLLCQSFCLCFVISHDSMTQYVLCNGLNILYIR